MGQFSVEKPELPGSVLSGNQHVMGHVVGVHIEDRHIIDGRFDISSARPIARCGYLDYVVGDKPFSIERPSGGGNPTE